MTEQIPVEVRISKNGPKYNIFLTGQTSADSGIIGGDAIISLGGVEVLRTHDISLRKDMGRFEKEIDNDTLSIRNNFNIGLIPIIEMMGERKEVIRRLNDYFTNNRYFLTSEVMHPEDGILFASAEKRSSIGVQIARKYSNPKSSEYLIDIRSPRKPSDFLISELNNSSAVVAPCKCNWGAQRVPFNHFYYRLGLELPTRTEPEELSNNLIHATSELVKILEAPES